MNTWKLLTLEKYGPLESDEYLSLLLRYQRYKYFLSIKSVNTFHVSKLAEFSSINTSHVLELFNYQDFSSRNTFHVSKLSILEKYWYLKGIVTVQMLIYFKYHFSNIDTLQISILFKHWYLKSTVTWKAPILEKHWYICYWRSIDTFNKWTVSILVILEKYRYFWHFRSTDTFDIWKVWILLILGKHRYLNNIILEKYWYFKCTDTWKYRYSINIDRYLKSTDAWIVLILESIDWYLWSTDIGKVLILLILEKYWHLKNGNTWKYQYFSIIILQHQYFSRIKRINILHESKYQYFLCSSTSQVAEYFSSIQVINTWNIKICEKYYTF